MLWQKISQPHCTILLNNWTNALNLESSIWVLNFVRFQQITIIVVANGSQTQLSSFAVHFDDELAGALPFKLIALSWNLCCGGFNERNAIIETLKLATLLTTFESTQTTPQNWFDFEIQFHGFCLNFQSGDHSRVMRTSERTCPDDGEHQTTKSEENLLNWSTV